MLLEILQQIWESVWQQFKPLFSPIWLIPIGAIILICIKKNRDYKASAYYQITKLSFLTIWGDKGRFGEYLTYRYLKKYEKSGGKFLFNVYIPKENEETTEIDVLMINQKGIFVFESKNYSGWIFGKEEQKSWCQTLPEGRGKSHKEHFYNPIMQNRSHIKYLKALIEEEIPMHSIIVFSERCTLKNVEVKSTDISVIKRNEVEFVVSNICKQMSGNALTEEDIARIYTKLYPYTQVSDEVKAQHIENIQNKLEKKPDRGTAKSGHSSGLENKEQQIAEPSVSIQEANVSEEAEEVQEVKGESQTPETDLVKPMEADTPKPQTEKCPKCGGNLVLRTASRGANAGNQFWGCANYPKCRYVRSVE